MGKYLDKMKNKKGWDAGAVSKKRINRQMIGIADNIVFTKRGAWAYYKIPVEPYDFLPKQEQFELGVSTTNALVNIFGDRQTPLEFHILGDSIPIDLEKFREQTAEEYKHKSTIGEFGDFMTRQIAFLEFSEFTRKTVLLGIKISERGVYEDDGEGNILVLSIKNAWNRVRTVVNSLFPTVTVVTEEEEKSARIAEERIDTIISNGNLRGERASSEEILLLTKKIFYPFMPVPYLDIDYDNHVDEGDILAETASTIVERSQYLEMRQIVSPPGQEDAEDMVGYRAVLTMRKFARDRQFPTPTPFFYAINQFGYPFPFYARFVMHSSETMRKLIDRKSLESQDEIKNIEEGNVREMPDDVVQSLHDMRRIKMMINESSEPWIEGSYRIVVEADTVKKLRNFASRLKQSYKDMGITLHWSHGDQLDLLLESMPGDFLRQESYNQVTPLVHIGTSGFNFATEFGDEIIGK